jgi:hypothetical protein
VRANACHIGDALQLHSPFLSGKYHSFDAIYLSVIVYDSSPDEPTATVVLHFDARV